jgi:hypothetical protein
VLCLLMGEGAAAELGAVRAPDDGPRRAGHCPRPPGAVKRPWRSLAILFIETRVSVGLLYGRARRSTRPFRRFSARAGPGLRPAEGLGLLSLRRRRFLNQLRTRKRFKQRLAMIIGTECALAHARGQSHSVRGTANLGAQQTRPMQTGDSLLPRCCTHAPHGLPE